MLTIVLSFCRLYILLLGLVGTASSKAPPEDSTPYAPNGPIVGDFTDVESFPPKVVLNYLAACANVSIADPDGCLVSTFAKLRVPFDLEDTFACDSCENPPNVTDAFIATSAIEAQAACVAMGEPVSMADTDELTQKYKTIVNSTCWGSLRNDDSYLFVEAEWIKTCASTKLPYPIPEDDMNMFMVDSVHHRSILTCMLDRVFETDPIIFGLEAALDGSPESCFAPGYDTITSTCPSVLGPKTLQKCLNDSQSDDGDDGFIPMDNIISMDYSGNSKAVFVEEFCGLLEALSTDVGRGCLLDLCKFDPTPSPSFSSPSVKPSSSPTAMPSRLPSSQPAVSQSVSPSYVSSVSQFPTFDTVQAVVGVKFSSTITLNIPLNDMPISSSDRDSFINVMEMAIESVVDGPSSATVRVSTEARRSRRLLSGGTLDLDVEVAASRDCRVDDCDTYGNLIVDQIEQGIRSTLVDGSLTSSINKVALAENVVILQTAIIINIQFLNEAITVDDVEVEVEDDGETSSAPMSIGQLSGIVAVVLSVLLV